jgi:hypothetical protein
VALSVNPHDGSSPTYLMASRRARASEHHSRGGAARGLGKATSEGDDSSGGRRLGGFLRGFESHDGPLRKADEDGGDRADATELLPVRNRLPETRHRLRDTLGTVVLGDPHD